MELSGSLGDLGTFLPLAIGLSAVCGMHLGAILFFAGLMNIWSGLRFRQPIPAEPMKAIAAIAIADHLTAGQIAASGMAIGVALLVIAGTGASDWLTRRVPRAVVRGLQCGIGVKLVLEGFRWLTGLRIGLGGIIIGDALPVLGGNSLLVAAMAAIALLVPRARRAPMLLAVIAAGLVIAAYAPAPAQAGTPTLSLVLPAFAEWKSGILHAALPQLPLTLMNSVIAVCALSAAWFPGAGVSPNRMTLRLGLVNLLFTPLGAMPMCHGAGGLAAQIRFGARTGGSVIMLGVIFVACGLLAAGNAGAILAAFPTSILAVLLMISGCSLAACARDTLSGKNLIVLAATTLTIVLVDTAIGFLVGIALASAVRLATRKVPA